MSRVASQPVAAPPEVPDDESCGLDLREQDPREQEPWFLGLPAHKQRELRDYWDDRDLDGLRWREQSSRRARILAREGAALMCIPLLLVNGLLTGPVQLVLLLVIGAFFGAGVGVFLHVRGGGRFQAALVGMVTWLFVQLAIGGVAAGGSILDAPPIMFLFLGAWLASTTFGVWGIRLEFRRLEGVD